MRAKGPICVKKFAIQEKPAKVGERKKVGHA